MSQFWQCFYAIMFLLLLLTGAKTRMNDGAWEEVSVTKKSKMNSSGMVLIGVLLGGEFEKNNNLKKFEKISRIVFGPERA